MVVLPRALKQFIEHFTFTHFVIRLIKEDGVCSIVFQLNSLVAIIDFALVSSKIETYQFHFRAQTSLRI
jgi:hypothetical protein